MAMWNEKKLRLSKGMEISSLVNDEVLQRNRYYVTSIAEIIQFLAVNELPMRGSYNIEEHEKQSLFKNLFEFTLRKDKKLMECYKGIPRNATYLSPEIQNDVIQILIDCVRESIVDDVKNADVPWFTILADGTKDKRGRENFALGIRYVKESKAYESTLCIKTTEELYAHSLAELTLNILQESDINTDYLLMRTILKTLEPADRQLQARETSLNDSTKLIDAVIESLQNLRTDQNCYEETLQYSTTGDFEVSESEHRTKRKKTASSIMKDFVVMVTTGLNDEIDEDNILLKQIFNEILDIILIEMNKRFSNNKELLKSISAAEALDFDNIQHLSSLGITLPSKEEFAVVKSYLQKIASVNTFEEIYRQKTAFEDTYKLLATARTFGCSTALCESTFSVLTRIDRPQRLSMTHQRLANLVFLGFEKERTNNVDFQKVLRKFNEMKNRRLQLF
jgi:hypothetical protein